MRTLFLGPEEVRNLLVAAGAEQHGHFQLTSGLHSNTYIDKDVLSVHTRIMRTLCQDIVLRFAGVDFDVVIGPAYGAIVAAHVVAQVANDREGSDRVKPVFAVKTEDGSFEIRKTMVRHVVGQKCLMIEDILTTGGSAKMVVEAAMKAGAGEIVGLAAFCNRGKVSKEDIGLPESAKFEALLVLDNVPKYEPRECPLCHDGMPISKVFGHGGTK